MAIHQIVEQVPVEELGELVDHLSKDRGMGPSLVRLIEQGGGRVSKYVIRTVNDLGQLDTCFENIGRAKAIDRCQLERFPVQSAFSAFEEAAADGLDEKDDLASLRHLMHLLETGHAPGKITGLGRPDRFFLADGNKSAIAAYEYSRRYQARSISVPLYLIEEV